MIYSTADCVLNRRSSKKVASHTHLHYTIAGIKLRYYDTDILYFKSNGDILVDTNNIRTKSTKDRLNAFLPLRHVGIYSRGGVWFWKDGVPFKDRTVVRDDTCTRRVLQKMTQFD